MKQVTFTTISIASGLLAAQVLGMGQTKTLSITANDPRPLQTALGEIERLSGIPVNYEDVRTDFSGDQRDYTAGNVTPAQQALALQNGFGQIKVIAPRGGTLEATIAVDASSGALRDANSATTALNDILLAYKASNNLPGAFRVESHDGGFFVEPIEIRDINGQTVAVTPVLATPITISVVQQNAAETLDLILAEVLKNSGFKIGVGMVPIQALATRSVTIDAVQVPAGQVLAEFMNRLLDYGKVLPQSSPSFAYRVLYDPKLKYYMFNMVEVGLFHVRFAPPPQAPPPSPPAWFTPSRP